MLYANTILKEHKKGRKVDDSSSPFFAKRKNQALFTCSGSLDLLS